MMTLLSARYPGYGWERNQGYATLEHRRAIRRLGLTPFHRRSFLALQRTLAGDQISLDLFDEAVASISQADELNELDRLDGLRDMRLDEFILDDQDVAVQEPDPAAAAAIAEAQAIVRDVAETQGRAPSPDTIG
jgi:hypothetical protein